MMEQAANTFQSSPQQDDQWRREPDGPRGRVQAVIAVTGEPERDALAAALAGVVARHESLRTTFVRQPGIRIPLQAVADELPPVFGETEVAADELDAAVQSALVAEREAVLDFERGPLVRAHLLRTAGERHALVLTVSTLCADASSMPVIVSELAAECAGAAEGDPLQYADYAAWALELAESEDEEALAARRGWSALTPANDPALPFQRGHDGPFAVQTVDIAVDAPVSSSTLHAAWHALVHRLSGQDAVDIGYLACERRHEDLDGAIGAFARPVPLRTHAEPNTDFAALVQAVASARGRALELADYATAEADEAPAIGFCDFDPITCPAGALTLKLERVLTTGHPWRLWLSCAREGQAARPALHFDPNRHATETVCDLASQLAVLVSAAAGAPQTPLERLPLLDSAQRERLLHGFGAGETAPVPELRVHEVVTRHAAQAGRRTAVVDGEGSITYAELERRANQLAHHLRAGGLGPEATVGLLLPRSTELVVALLGILKAGGAYVPLNPEHPSARLRAQLDGAGAAALIASERHLAALAGWEGQIICPQRDRAVLASAPDTAPDVVVAPEQLAYVIFTSGSTGTPKGVAVTHGNLDNYAHDITRRLSAEAQPLSFGLVTSPATDLGNTSLFGALASGGTLVIAGEETAGDAAALARQFASAGVDVLKITPSHLGALIAGGEAGVLPRQTLVLGGERAPWDLVERVRALAGCRILNHYGPTETTVGCATFPVGDGPGAYQPATVPIGRPISRTACYVLDRHGEPVPAGVPGTLFVGGAGVARDYIGAPELTAERFVADPFAGDGARMYDTGDIVRWLPDGALEFLGRTDEQVKIRGYRVEPAEIEVALRSHPGVREAVVTAPAAAGAEQRLVAHVAGDVTPEALTEHLAALLPEFMVPAAIVVLDRLPRTPSGKIDRRALPEPALTSDSGIPYVAPRTPTEQAIAEMWARTLGVERVGIQDDFFELGGHSLLATQVVAQLRTELAVDLPLHSLFTCPTVELLAAEIVSLMGASEEDETERLLAELEGLSDEEARRLLAETEASGTE